MRTEDMEITKLIPYARNPRRNSSAVDSVAASIKEFGFLQPVVVDINLVVVAGHTRLLAASKLGMLTVPIVRAVDLTPEQIKAYRIIDNKVAELAEWDPTLLSLELDELSEFSLEGFGVDFSDDIKCPSDVDISDTDVPELHDAPQTVCGDLWLLGKHRLLCGDATSDIDYYHLFKVPYGGTIPRLASIVVTDPPYGVSYGERNRFLNSYDRRSRCTGDIEGDSRPPEEMETFWKDAFAHMHRFTSSESAYYVTAPQGSELFYALSRALLESGYLLKHTLVWAKSQFVLGRGDYHYQHEPILYGWKKGGTHRFYGGRGESSLWEIPKPTSSKLHPTMKPVELYTRALVNSTMSGEVMLEPFAGSGTGLIAAHRTDRVCYGLEVDPLYCDVICQRYYDETGEVPTTASGKHYVPRGKAGVTPT